MEVAVELEDDLFFADLSKQISLLIMDDDNDDDPVDICPSVSFQTFCGANYPRAQSQHLQEQICRRDQSKGTGVFIPRSLQPRRKHNNNSNKRQGRCSSFTTKSNNSRQQHDNSTKMASQASYNNSFYYPRKG